MLNWLAGIALGIYLVGVLGSGLVHYGDSADQDLSQALQRGLAWPGALVQMARAPAV